MQSMKIGRTVLLLSLILALGGCATAGAKSTKYQLDELQFKVTRIEQELRQKDARIGYLEDRLKQAERMKSTQNSSPAGKGSSVSAVKSKRTTQSRPSPQFTHKNVQTALKKAGFYNGPIDGKIGDGTRKAIKKFQSTNGLEPDGLVGRRTWAKLSKYVH